MEKKQVQGVHMLVVIDHREAKIFNMELKGGAPERLSPHKPVGTDRYLHEVQDDGNGQRKPENKQFYEAVASAVKHADQVLVFGNAVGAASAMEQLKNDLASHHKDIAARVIGWLHVDEKHTTENQLLAKARELYEKNANS